MTRNCFGVKDAQFNVKAVIRNHAVQFKTSHPGAFRAITEDLYMDDLISGGETISEVQRTQNDVSEILSKAGMVMKKWKVSGVKNSNDCEPILGPQAPEKVLGIIWKTEKDILTFDSKHVSDFVEAAKPTKRTIMGAAARLYDPTGFLSPFITQI